MGGKFVEKHKRKSIFAALLLIFQGRAKYVGILLIITVLSIPFLVSGDTFGRILELGPVAAFLRTVGLGGVVSAINPRPNDMLKAALDKAAEDSKAESYWAKFLKSLNASMPPDGGPSSIAMLRGGSDDLFGPPVVKDDKNDKRGPGQVKGAVSAEEQANGGGAEGVDLQGLLAGGPGAGGLPGDLAAGSFGEGSSYGGSGPYANRTLLSGRGGAGGSGAAAMYSRVMGQSSSKVPVPTSPSKVKAKLMGRVSGFSWRNVGYRSSSAKMDVRLGSKKPMFQLAETFAMTGAAYKSKESALEYQASYTGSTYDGNDTNADVIQTDAGAPPSVPDTSFTGSMINDVGNLQGQAKQCSDASGTHGAIMSDDGKKMEDTGKSLGKPPKCCSGGVGAWNAKIDRIVGYCNDYNVHEAQLAAACQNRSSPMKCGNYSKMHINPCSKWKCWLAVFLMILLGGLLGPLGAVIVGVMAIGSMLGNGNMFGPVGDIVSGFISKIAGGD